MNTFTVAYDGYDNGTAYYHNDKLYAFVHVNDEYEKEDILLGVIEHLDIQKVRRICIDDLLEYIDENDGCSWEFEYPRSLAELEKQLQETS